MSTPRSNTFAELSKTMNNPFPISGYPRPENLNALAKQACDNYLSGGRMSLAPSTPMPLCSSLHATATFKAAPLPTPLFASLPSNFSLSAAPANKFESGNRTTASTTSNHLDVALHPIHKPLPSLLFSRTAPNISFTPLNTSVPTLLTSTPTSINNFTPSTNFSSLNSFSTQTTITPTPVIDHFALNVDYSLPNNRFTGYPPSDYGIAALKGLVHIVMPILNLMNDTNVIVASHLPESKQEPVNLFDVVDELGGASGIKLIAQALHANPELLTIAHKRMEHRGQILGSIAEFVRDIGILSDYSDPLIHQLDLASPDQVNMHDVAMENMSRRFQTVANFGSWMIYDATGPELTEMAFSIGGPYATFKVISAGVTVTENMLRFRTLTTPPLFPDLLPNLKSHPNAGPLRIYSPEKIINSQETISGIYVVTKEGKLILGDRGENARYHMLHFHSTYAKGEEIVMGGEYSILKGRDVKINNQTGHYESFGPIGTKITINKFKQAGFEMIEFTHFEQPLLPQMLDKVATDIRSEYPALKPKEMVKMLEELFGPALIYSCPKRKTLAPTTVEVLNNKFAPPKFTPDIIDEMPNLLKLPNFPGLPPVPKKTKSLIKNSSAHLTLFKSTQLAQATVDTPTAKIGIQR